MKQDTEATAKKFTQYTVKLFLFMIFTFLSAGAFQGLEIGLGKTIKWMDLISQILLILTWLLIIVSLIIPGLLITLRTPWLARAWLIGINTFLFPYKPWNRISAFGKFIVYFIAAISFFLAIAIIFVLVSKNI